MVYMTIKPCAEWSEYSRSNVACLLTITSRVPQGCELVDLLGPLGMTGMYVLYMRLVEDLMLYFAGLTAYFVRRAIRHMSFH